MNSLKSTQVVYFLAAVLSFCAIAISFISTSPNSDLQNASHSKNYTESTQNGILDKEKVIGSVFAVLATIGAATYKTLFAKFIQSPNVRQVALILSLIGVIDLFIFLPVAFILVHFDFESISYHNAPWDLIIYQGTSF